MRGNHELDRAGRAAGRSGRGSAPSRNVLLRVSTVVTLLALSMVLLQPALVALRLPADPSAASVAAAAEGTPPRDVPAVPVRIRVPDLGIDLPVVSSERTVPGNVRDYPLCDVAQYWTIYDLPGAPGTTWIYAHAQPGMFLPLLLTTTATNGSGLIGKRVTLQLEDGRLLRYRITEVKQHAVDRRIALRDRPRQQRLILQTSEGPPGTVPKLQVAARLAGARWTDDPAPKARPRACWQPRTTAKTSGGKKNQAGATSPPTVTNAPTREDGPEPVSLVLGGGAVLLGSALVAVYLIRRPPSSQRRPPRP